MNRFKFGQKWLLFIPLLAMFQSCMTVVFAQPVSIPGGPAPAWRLSGPYKSHNLSAFLVHGNDRLPSKAREILTLQEGMLKGKVVVYETSEVSQLVVENLSDMLVFIQSGDIVKGGQQDRTLQFDMLLPPRSGKVPLPSLCVESGRWSARGNESSQRFSTSGYQLATKDLKAANQGIGSQSQSAGITQGSIGPQGAVWHTVAELQRKLAKAVAAPVQSDSSRSSLQLTLEQPAVKSAVGPYIKDLSPIVATRGDVIGYAFVINGKINSADIYASGKLFRKLWPKLLQSSATEAAAEFKKGRSFANVSNKAVQAWLKQAEGGKVSRKQIAAGNQLSQWETDKSVMFQNQNAAAGAAWLHRNYLSK